MSVPTVVVTINVFGPDGAAISGAVVKAQLSGLDVYNNQLIYPTEQTATTNGSGVATISLFPNTLGERNTFYTFKAQSSDSTKTYWTTTAVVPNAAKNLAQISNTHPPTADDTGVSDFLNLPFLDQQSKFESYLKNYNTASRTYVFPDEAGHVAVLDDDTVIGTSSGILTLDSDGTISASGIALPANGTFALALGTEQASTSGLTIDFTGIPSWARRITVNMNGISANAHDFLALQIGDSGGIASSGYSAAVSDKDSASNSASGFPLTCVGQFYSGGLYNGVAVLNAMDVGGTKWCVSGTFGSPSFAPFWFAGAKTLSARLDRLRLLCLSGATFDAGSINISYE